MVYGIGFAMAMPSISLITLDLFPTRRGMAASLQGFVSGMVNVVTAGVISPRSGTTRAGSPLGMLAMMLPDSAAGGSTCARRAATRPPRRIAAGAGGGTR